MAARLKVMVVDDSSVIRGFLTSFLEGLPDVEVVAAVDNGVRALQQLQESAPDIVLLDIDMPVMDGLTALPLLLEKKPNLRIIVCSAASRDAAATAARCLALGAVDYLPKPTAKDMAAADMFRNALQERIYAQFSRQASFQPEAHENVEDTAPRIQTAPQPAAALAVCSSTGGPQALLQLFQSWDTALAQPVFITQHMPAHFTRVLAENISGVCNLPCAEAVQGETVQAGHIYIAPGDYHMTLTPEKRISLLQTPPENFCRPSADPMLRSLTAVYGAGLVVAVLTGMGRDALAGCRAAADAGAAIIAQDEASSTVWGMPAAVVHAGLCRAVVPLPRMAETLRKYLGDAR